MDEKHIFNNNLLQFNKNITENYDNLDFDNIFTDYNNNNDNNYNDNMLIKLKSFEKKIPPTLSKEKKMSLVIISLFDLLFKNDKDKLDKVLKFLASKNILELDMLNNKYDIFKNNLSLLIDAYNKNLSNETLNYSNNTYRNNYNQISVLGQGSFGTVYKVYHKLERKYYAIKKIFLTEEFFNENINLLNETYLYCNLKHKNIVKYNTSWISNDIQSIIEFNNIIDLNDMEPINNACQILFIQMELCNFTLEEYLLTQMTDDSLKKRILYFIDIIDGLKYLHDNNIIHRDLKSNNIFFVDNSNGEYDVKIGDFGLCKKKDNLIENKILNEIDIDIDNTLELEKFDNNIILMSSYIGNSYYRAPEINDKKNINFSFDIYSLGIILIELILNCKTNFEKIKIIMSIKSNPLNIKKIDNILTHKYDEIIINMLNNNYSERISINELSNYFNK
jgi:hypothetical protein